MKNFHRERQLAAAQFILIAVLGGLAGPASQSRAFAQSSAPPREKIQLAEGDAAMARGDLVTAQRAYEDSYIDSRQPTVLCLLAAVAERRGAAGHSLAVDLYRRCLGLGAEKLDPKTRAHAEQVIQDSTEDLVELNVRSDVGTVLWIDARLVGSITRGKESILMSPGTHQILARFGKKERTLSVDAKLGMLPGIVFDFREDRTEQFDLLATLLIVSWPDARGNLPAFEPALRSAIDAALLPDGGKLLPPQVLQSLLREPARLAQCAQKVECILTQGKKMGVPYVLQLSMVGSPASASPEATANIEARVSLLDVAVQAESAAENRRCQRCTTAALLAELAAASVQLFQKRQQHGNLELKSTPSPAELRIDGQLRGLTPFDGSLFVGAHTVELSRPHFMSVTQTVTISENGRHRLHPLLELAPLSGGERFMHTGKWVFGALGLAALAAGGGLFAIDGQLLTAENGMPVNRLATQAPGAALLAIGGASVVVSAVLFALDGSLQKARRVSAAPTH